jgi:bifunctional DNase/RNase
MKKMEIKGLLLDPVSNTPVVVLRDAEERLFLPIWIGIFEANAIALRMESIETPRPLTHDLLGSLLAALDVEVLKVVINDLKENTFYARIYLRQGVREFVIDSRPSDALAIAVRAEAEIYVEESVLDASRTVEIEDPRNPERLRKWLEEVDPDELGKYRM